MKLSDPPDLFTKDIVSVNPEKPVADVITLMRGAKPISCVLVKEDEALVGIFTERDVVALVSEKRSFMDRPIGM